MPKTIDHLLHFLIGMDGLNRRWPEVALAALMLMPWPMAMSIGWSASRRRTVGVWIVGVYLYSRLVQDVAIFGPIVCVGSLVVWLTLRRRLPSAGDGHKADGDVPIGAGGMAWMAWLHPAIAMVGVYAAAYRPDAAVTAWIVCFALVGLLIELSQGRRGDAAARSAVSNVLAATLIALPLAWTLDGLRVDRFLPMALIATAGWIACCFQLWRARIADAGRRSSLARWRAVACWTMVGLLLSIDCMETYFRYVYDESDAYPTLKTARRWWKRHVVYNSWGFRGPEPNPLGRFDDHVRVAVLGDSFGFGQGVEQEADLLHAQLQRALQSRLGADQKVAVFNISLPGMTTHDEWNVFNDRGPQLRPHVVVQVYMLNDINDGTTFLPIKHPKLACWRSLMAASYSIEFVIWRVYDRWFRDGRDQPFRELTHFRNDEVFAKHAEHVELLADAIANVGAVHVVVVFGFLGSDRHWDAQRFALDRIEGLFDDLHIRHVDAEDCFDAKQRRFIVNPFDPHPNADAYAAVVPAIVDKIDAELKHSRIEPPEPKAQSGR